MILITCSVLFEVIAKKYTPAFKPTHEKLVAVGSSTFTTFPEASLISSVVIFPNN